MCKPHKHISSQITTPSLIKLTSLIIYLSTKNVKSRKTLNHFAIQPLSPHWFICTIELALIQWRVTQKGGKGWHNSRYDWCSVWLVLVLIQKSRQLFEPASYFCWVLFLLGNASLSLNSQSWLLTLSARSFNVELTELQHLYGQKVKGLCLVKRNRMYPKSPNMVIKCLF